jgi:hypothetical protein|tara:strand:- start:3331 stop:3597 length:267 start_codon:yes stop_codon:yes gene_type:complete
MAAISIGDCTVTMVAALAGLNVQQIVTPATADDGDTIECVSLFQNAVIMASAQGATDNTLMCNISSSTIIEIPGTTDNEARTIYVVGY